MNLPPLPPPPAEIVTVLQDPASDRLPSGMALTWLADHQRPTFRLLVRATPRRDLLSPEEGPLLHLLMVLLRDGFQGSAAARGSALLDLPVRTSASWDGISLMVRMEGTTQGLETALARLAEGFIHPVLRVEALEQLRGLQRIMPTPAIERLTADLTVRAASQCLQPLPLPTERQLDTIRLQDLRALHARCLGPGNLEIFVLGDLDGAQVRQCMARSFDGWATGLKGGNAPAGGGQPCGKLWICGAGQEPPEVRIGFCLRGDGTVDPAAVHLLPFLFRRAAQKAPIALTQSMDPATGYGRVRALVPVGTTPAAFLEQVESWLAALAEAPPTDADLAEAKTAWRIWQRSLLLHPAERLAWMASGVYPDQAMAARVEALPLARVAAVWKERLQPNARQTLLLGGDAKALQTRTGAGGPAPEVIQVKR